MRASPVFIASVAATVGISALLAGCASNKERPVQEMARARTLIEEADRNGAQQFAGADLERAREELRNAEQADEKKDGVTARRMAVQAEVDAQLANAKMRQGKAEQAAQEVASSIETLRQESQRASEPDRRPPQSQPDVILPPPQQ